MNSNNNDNNVGPPPRGGQYNQSGLIGPPPYYYQHWEHIMGPPDQYNANSQYQHWVGGYNGNSQYQHVGGGYNEFQHGGHIGHIGHIGPPLYNGNGVGHYQHVESIGQLPYNDSSQYQHIGHIARGGGYIGQPPHNDYSQYQQGGGGFFVQPPYNDYRQYPQHQQFGQHTVVPRPDEQEEVDQPTGPLALAPEQQQQSFQQLQKQSLKHINDVDTASSLTSGDGEEAVCYLCLDARSDGAGQPLRRDCACRGTDAGFVHLSCLINYATAKSVQTRGLIEFIKPWRECPCCHQYYQNEFRIDIASKFVSFVRRQYPDDTQRQVGSLYLKLGALCFMLGGLQPVQKREAEVTANVLLSLIERMKLDASPLSMRYSQIEAHAYAAHGEIALNERTEESARRAEGFFVKNLKVCEAVGDVVGIATAKANIAVAKSKYESGNNIEELLRTSKELYKVRVAELGEKHLFTIRAGKNFAIDLLKANRGEEARDLLTKLLVTSKQELGPHHCTTKDVELSLTLTLTLPMHSMM